MSEELKGGRKAINGKDHERGGRIVRGGLPFGNLPAGGSESLKKSAQKKPGRRNP